MAVKVQTKIDIGMEAIVDLVAKMAEEHGETTNYWLKVIQKTRLYDNILNPKTALWGEGTMYLYGELMQEIGKQEKRNQRKVTKEIMSTLWLQVRILGMLQLLCRVSQETITEMIDKIDLLGLIEDIYFMLHQEGDYANMQHMQEALKVRGYNIKIPSMSSYIWKRWSYQV